MATNIPPHFERDFILRGSYFCEKYSMKRLDMKCLVMADEELTKAFEELKNKNIETATRIKSVDHQVCNKGHSRVILL